MSGGKLPHFLMMGLLLVMAFTAHSRNGKWNDKISLWEDAVRKSPEKARAYNNLGEAYHQQARLSEAVIAYNKSIALDPYRSLDAYSNLAAIYVTLGQQDLAIDAFTKILLINTGDYIAYANRANAYARKGDYASAVRDYSSAVAVFPSFGEAYLRRASAFAMLQDTARAGEDYRKACMLGIREACEKIDTASGRVHN